MEIFKPGLYVDFMAQRRFWITLSLSLVAVSLFLFLVWPKPNYGIDFSGGTEIEVRFKRSTDTATARAALRKAGFGGGSVIAVRGVPDTYILRVREVSTIGAGRQGAIRRGLVGALSRYGVLEVMFSPGGDKITVRLNQPAPLDEVRAAFASTGVEAREVRGVGAAEGAAGEEAQRSRFEAGLVGVGDRVIDGLRAQLGADRVPEHASRIEWVGPRAGAELREKGILSILYAIFLIIIYVAVRFDLRFAPGGIVALVHDAVVTVGVMVAVGKEINLTTVAAVLTIVGYSINDTIVIYDRIRENLAKLRERDLFGVINISISETLSRTVLTNATVLMSILAFLIWGTSLIRDFAFAMLIGMIAGTYSSIYVAAPLTEWFDRKLRGKPAA